MRDMMAQAVAASRYADGEDADMIAEDDDEDMEEDSSETTDAPQAQGPGEGEGGDDGDTVPTAMDVA